MRKRIVFYVALFAILCSCSTEKKGWTVMGDYKGAPDGEVVIDIMNDWGLEPVKGEIKDGKFTLSGEALPEVGQAQLLFGDAFTAIFVENGTTTLTGTYTVTEYPGGNGRAPMTFKNIMTETNVNPERSDFYDRYNELFTLAADYRKAAPNYNDPSLSPDEVSEMFDKQQADVLKIELDYANKYNNHPIGGYVLYKNMHGLGKEDLKKLLANVSPELDTYHTRLIKNKINDVTHKSVEELVSASNVQYKVDKEYKGADLKNVEYLGVMSNNNLVTLDTKGEITIISSEGEKLSSFKPESASPATVFAIDNKDQIYVITPNVKEIEKKIRGKVIKTKVTESNDCTIFNSNGEKLGGYKLANSKKATGARVADGKLFVADYDGADIDIYNATNGVVESSIKDMRVCCGILDFSINANKEILVANLGAFRVQGYNYDGKQTLAFGARGNEISQFHGCCNPVSVAYLSNGAIVTVEKDPTRVKIYSKEGAKTIAGIDEMVVGCRYIPMIVDKSDNLYMASAEKGVVRCVPL